MGDLVGTVLALLLPKSPPSSEPDEANGEEEEEEEDEVATTMATTTTTTSTAMSTTNHQGGRRLACGLDLSLGSSGMSSARALTVSASACRRISFSSTSSAVAKKALLTERELFPATVKANEEEPWRRKSMRTAPGAVT